MLKECFILKGDMFMKSTKKLLMSLVLSATFVLSSFEVVLATPSADKLYSDAFNAVNACKSSFNRNYLKNSWGYYLIRIAILK